MRLKMSPLGVVRLAVEDAEQVFEQRVLEFRVVFRKPIKQRLKVALDGVHGFDQRRAEVRAFMELEQFVVAGFLRPHERAAFFEVGFDLDAVRRFSGGLVSYDLS